MSVQIHNCDREEKVAGDERGRDNVWDVTEEVTLSRWRRCQHGKLPMTGGKEVRGRAGTKQQGDRGHVPGRRLGTARGAEGDRPLGPEAGGMEAWREGCYAAMSCRAALRSRGTSRFTFAARGLKNKRDLTSCARKKECFINKLGQRLGFKFCLEAPLASAGVALHTHPNVSDSPLSLYRTAIENKHLSFVEKPKVAILA